MKTIGISMGTLVAIWAYSLLNWNPSDLCRHSHSLHAQFPQQVEAAIKASRLLYPDGSKGRNLDLSMVASHQHGMGDTE